MDTNRKASILIVDDNPSVTRTIALILERKGYLVVTASNGLEAVERIEERPYDMVLMDIKMPFMNGVDGYKCIKGIRPEAAVIMMTAYALEDLVAEALQEGAYDVIYKPLDIERTLHLIEQAREERKGMMILVVDDDPGTCFTLCQVLERRGYTVAVAHHGERAIALARERHYDAVIVDINLPAINGLEIYRAIREFDPHVMTIMMTAHCQEMADLARAALRNHASACLYKPLDLDELLGLLEETVRQRANGGTGEKGNQGIRSPIAQPSHPVEEDKDGQEREHPDR